MHYSEQISALLSPAERAVFRKLSTPTKIQNYLEALPQNFSTKSGETCRSPRRIIEEGKAYCFEAAVFAATALAFHGREPLIMDLRATKDDEDHVVTLFKEGNLWGAISKTNAAVLRWRDPVYKSVRELAMSYFHEYFLDTSGKKTLLSYSKPFNLKRYPLKKWLTTHESLDWMAADLDDSPHLPIAPKSVLKNVRKATPFERQIMSFEEWKEK